MTGRQCRVTARKITHAATATMRIPVVAQATLTSLLHVLRAGVRCAANQRGMAVSPSHLLWLYFTTSSPKPTITPRISTQATTRPAAIRARERVSDLFTGASGWAGLL